MNNPNRESQKYVSALYKPKKPYYKMSIKELSDHTLVCKSLDKMSLRKIRKIERFSEEKLARKIDIFLKKHKKRKLRRTKRIMERKHKKTKNNRSATKILSGRKTRNNKINKKHRIQKIKNKTMKTNEII